ncbi:hypothetical protein [Paenibacillus sp. YPG26]|uniref:hypothetical protein n=1 Tax=Paenibacillus sp. YPG26 TaxID=2878915 RepID=UPI00203D2296|nr:hypothetical protein [Paenibacillus sp. YPG26]USB31957.1 hypothetical protein LDO05_11450 [Paenibacillus sp. YPG26]
MSKLNEISANLHVSLNSGAMLEIVPFLQERQLLSPLMVMDENTHKAAGVQIRNLLIQAGIQVIWRVMG